MKKILLVEADQQVLDTLCLELQDAGYQTLTAHNAQTALTLLDASVDLMIICVELPDQNGFVLCSKLKKDPETAQLPIFITSSAQSTAAFEIHIQLATHADGYFLKPIDIDSLKEELSSLFADLDAYAQAQAHYEPENDEQLPQHEQALKAKGSPEPQAVHNVDDPDDEMLKALSLENMNLFEDLDNEDFSDVPMDMMDFDVDEPVDLTPDQSPSTEILSSPSQNLPPASMASEESAREKLSNAKQEEAKLGSQKTESPSLPLPPPKGITPISAVQAKQGKTGALPPPIARNPLPPVPVAKAAPATSFTQDNHAAQSNLSAELSAAQAEIQQLKAELSQKKQELQTLQSQHRQVLNRVQKLAQELLSLSNDS